MEILTPTSLPTMHDTTHRGLLIVISGPSGVGKGTIVKRLLEDRPATRLSVSVTTRAPRPGEKEGESYFYRSAEQFQAMIQAGEFLEYAQFGHNHYGTPRSFVEETLEKGFDVVLEIEPQGAIQVKERIADGVYVFVLPPSFDELEQRLLNRNTEPEEVRQLRLITARHELNYLPMYDYQVVNDDLEQAIETVKSILSAEHCRVRRNLRRL